MSAPSLTSSATNASASAQHAAVASNGYWPHLTFTQGLLVGQLSIILVVVALTRYLLFEDAPSPANKAQQQEEQEEEAVAGQPASRHFPVASAALKSTSSLLSLSLSSARLPYRVKSPPPPLTSGGHGSGPSLPALARIPQAVGYDMETAADIDVGWLNVLVAHVWEGYRDDFLAGGSDRKVDSVFSNGNDLDEDSEWIEEEDKSSDPQRTARDLMQDALNRPKLERGKMDFMDPIQVTECQVGNSYPIFSNARVRPRDDQGRVRIEMDIDYADVLSLSLQTSILINYPRPRFAVLPISLGLRLTRFSGTLSLSITSHAPSRTPSNKRSRHTLHISLHPDFLLNATCSSLVGSRAKLQDIPKIQQLILGRLRSSILERLGWPRSFDVELPDLVRRRRPRQRRRRSEAAANSRKAEDESLVSEPNLQAPEPIPLNYDEYRDLNEDSNPEAALQARRRLRARQAAAAAGQQRPTGQYASRLSDGSMPNGDFQTTPKARRAQSFAVKQSHTDRPSMPSLPRGYTYTLANRGPEAGVSATGRRSFRGDGNGNGNGTGLAALNGIDASSNSGLTSVSRRRPPVYREDSLEEEDGFETSMPPRAGGIEAWRREAGLRM